METMPQKQKYYVPADSKYPLVAGIIALLWLVFGYAPVYFGPDYGYISFFGPWVSFAILSVVPAILFVIAFFIIKKNALFLLLPWGAFVLYAWVLPVIIYQMHEPPLEPKFLEDLIKMSPIALTHACGMLLYYFTIKGCFKRKTVFMLFAVLQLVLFVLILAALYYLGMVEMISFMFMPHIFLEDRYLLWIALNLVLFAGTFIPLAISLKPVLDVTSDRQPDMMKEIL